LIRYAINSPATTRNFEKIFWGNIPNPTLRAGKEKLQKRGKKRKNTGKR